MTLADRALEIAAFLDIQPNVAMERMMEGAERTARLWNEADPKTEEERRQWYRTTDAYIYEASYWYEADRNIQQLHSVVSSTASFQGGRILDFGAGIGELIIELASVDPFFRPVYPNVSPVYMDVESLTSSFAKFRLKKRGLLDKVEFITTDGEATMIKDAFNLIFTLDTLEHLEDPYRYVTRLLDHLNTFVGRIILEYSLDFTDRYPMHVKKAEAPLKNLDNWLKDQGVIKTGSICGYPGGMYVQEVSWESMVTSNANT